MELNATLMLVAIQMRRTSLCRVWMLTIYTWNFKHFNRLGENIAAPVRQP
jgi:hypothetical protein